jgi:hypothetical protein
LKFIQISSELPQGSMELPEVQVSDTPPNGVHPGGQQAAIVALDDDTIKISITKQGISSSATIGFIICAIANSIREICDKKSHQ